MKWQLSTMYEQYDVKIIKLKSVLHNNLNIQFLVEITGSACCILKSDDARFIGKSRSQSRRMVVTDQSCYEDSSKVFEDGSGKDLL